MKKNQSISIVSFNTMGLFSFDSVKGFLASLSIKARQKKIAELLAKEDPDIIALQEVHTYTFLNLLKSTLKKHPYIAYKPLVYGPKGSLVIFSKIPFTEVEYINFKDRGSFFNSSIVALLRRSGMLRVRLKEQDVHIINAHLTQNGDFVWTTKSRFYRYIRSQLSQVTKKIKDLSTQDTDARIIVLGDFNTDKKSSLYKSFIKVSDLIDPFENLKTTTMHQEFLPSKKLARRIDYIFLHNGKEEFSILKSEELFIKKYLLEKRKMAYVSDHIGLKTEIKL
jgi:endonuclease/exonuclease/phosphatase family metal-dependent hydrolase